MPHDGSVYGRRPGRVNRPMSTLVMPGRARI
jgi:hypothetical protein